MILLAHPTGNNFVREAAMGMFQMGELFELHLGVAACGGNSFARVASFPGMSEIRRRTYDARLRNALRLHPWREAGRLIANRFGFRRITEHEVGYFSLDAVYRSFDKAIGKRIASLMGHNAATPSRPDCVYCYEDGALESFRAAKAAGLRCIYDLPIAYWQTSRRLLEEESRRWPEWQATLVGTRDSAAKCARKDAELELADIVICPSDFVADSIPIEIKATKKVWIVPFGSPRQSIESKEVPAQDKRTNAKLKVFFAGSMTQRKGLADLFAAMKLVDQDRCELHVLGSPIVPLTFYRDQLPNFTYYATRANEDLLALMRTMDVFVLPSVVEGRALVIQEAMSQGLPVIITPNTGCGDVVEVISTMNSKGAAFSAEDKVYGRGETGFLVPIRSPESIAECIRWCYEHRSEVVQMDTRPWKRLNRILGKLTANESLRP